MQQKKLSLTYKLLRSIGLSYPEEEYGQVSPWQVIRKFFSNPYHMLLLSMMNWVILEPIAPRLLRPRLLRLMGATVGKNVYIGDHVNFDQNRSHLITIGNHVHIDSGCRILCHKRDLSKYCIGDDYANLPYKELPVNIGDGTSVGMESFVMPGVTIGKGVVIGSGSLITKDIPDWSIAVGRPAKVVKKIPSRNS